MTLNTSEVDINNVTSVPKLNGFFLVKADLQGHNSNERHTDNLISVTDTAGAVRYRMQIFFHAAKYMDISEKKQYVLALFKFKIDHACALFLENHICTWISRYSRIQRNAGNAWHSRASRSSGKRWS